MRKSAKIYQFPARGAAPETSVLSGYVLATDLAEVVACMSDSELRRSAEASLRVPEDGKCFLHFNELLEFRCAGHALNMVAPPKRTLAK